MRLRLFQLMLVLSIVLVSPGCAAMKEWLTTPSVVTGKTPAEDAREAINSALTGDWIGMIVSIGSIFAAGVGSVFIGKKVVKRVKAKAAA